MGRRAWGGGHGEEGMGRRAWGGGHGEEGMGRRAWGGGHGEKGMGRRARESTVKSLEHINCGLTLATMYITVVLSVDMQYRYTEMYIRMTPNTMK